MDVRRLTDRRALFEGIDLWNDLHPTVPLARRLAEQRLFAPAPGVAVVAWGVYADGDLAGFLVAKYLRESVPGYEDGDAGWVSVVAADPLAVDATAATTALLERAVEHLRARGVGAIRVGSDVRKFFPGLPAVAEDRYADALEDAGFRRGHTTADLYCDVASPAAHATGAGRLDTPDGVTVRRARPTDEDALHAFMAAEFPGRWAFQVEANCRHPGGIDDYWLVLKGDDPVAFARTGTADSPVLSSCVNWVAKWGERYCGLGPIGVAEDERGEGYGLSLIASVAGAFRDAGYHHMTIDGVADGLLDYYAKLGFEPALEFVSYEYAP